ncbi:MAG: AraC family ligand binding domain-containing protein [Candidatus Dormibacteraeota bacterium]|nr:AraC family ligand binding domain-containing protein [Candidatus Dormibacteraeota bacterium]
MIFGEVSAPGGPHRPFGFEQIADCGSMRVVGLRLEPGQNVPEHRNAIPVALIVTVGRLRFDDGATSGEVGAGEMLLINPGERHTYQAEVDTSAYLVFAGLPGVRSRAWSLRRKS